MPATMGRPIPLNALDRAVKAAWRSRAGTAEFYRQLVEGELWALVPYHPEVVGEGFELKDGAPLPFAQLRDDESDVVPLFSSAARVEEGLRRGGVPPNTYAMGSMPARQLLEVLGATGLRAVINKSCATGDITIPPDLMRDLADGSALQPLDAGQSETVRVRFLDPADYPTALLQPVFEFMRRHRQFRTAWIFAGGGGGQAPSPAGEGREYRLLVLMDPRDDVLHHDFNMVLAAARQETKIEVTSGLADEMDSAYIEALFQQAQPFYVAVDYRRPSLPSGGEG